MAARNWRNPQDVRDTPLFAPKPPPVPYTWETSNPPLPSNGTPTSNAAAELAAPSAEQNRERIFAFIRDHGPASCEAAEVALSLKHQTVSPRILELIRADRIETVGRTTNTSGATARLYGVKQ